MKPTDMPTATLATYPRDLRAPGNHRFWVSLGASALTHAIALTIFAGLLLPFPAPVWILTGQPTVVQVVLSTPEPEPAPPEPAVAPAQVAPPVLEPVPVPQPTAKLAPPVQQTPIPPVLRADSRAAAASITGSDALIPQTPEAVPADAPTPPGDVAVGSVETAELLGHTQALRLAQRFPQRIAKPPRLKAPLVVPYPVPAARTWREARIDALLVVDNNGKVLETSIAPEDPLFGPTVRDALETAAFLPAEADGVAVSYWVIVEFVFTMRQLRQPRAAAAR